MTMCIQWQRLHKYSINYNMEIYYQMFKVLILVFDIKRYFSKALQKNEKKKIVQR
jgi:hypothetical protein